MVLDKNITKYIKIGDKQIISGQDGKTGIWYCKEFPADDTDEVDNIIEKLNRIYNKYNKNIKKEKKEKYEKKI